MNRLGTDTTPPMVNACRHMKRIAGPHTHGVPAANFQFQHPGQNDAGNGRLEGFKISAGFCRKQVLIKNLNWYLGMPR